MLKRRAMSGEIPVSTFIYVDNGVGRATRYWLDARPAEEASAPPILSASAFCQEPVMYRVHDSVFKRVLEYDQRVVEAYQEYVKYQL